MRERERRDEDGEEERRDEDGEEERRDEDGEESERGKERSDEDGEKKEPWLMCRIFSLDFSSSFCEDYLKQSNFSHGRTS